ncbi:unnamed protein product [Macrosiphum euphorbiae]|uniref:Uncharacterized protein n=1 Tax=Macrosiphum euphorbiae TaxID=13131 RepID=A0AAV0VNA4_9HEMI|nr:unnamed protein product [Macrosiphum euphorbiae]
MQRRRYTTAAALKLRQRVDRTGSFDLAFRPYPSTVDENNERTYSGLTTAAALNCGGGGLIVPTRLTWLFRPYPSTVDENKNERNGNDDDILIQLFDLGFTPYPVGKNTVVYRVGVSMSMLFTGPIYRLPQLPP